MNAPEIRCPTPDKVRFATAETAQGRADVRTSLGAQKKYHVYLCPCGWFHLTTQRPPKLQYTHVTTWEEMEKLSRIEFRHVVSCDVKNRLDTKTKGVLHSMEFCQRWRAELKLLWLETLVEVQKARDPRHKADIQQFQNFIAIRRQEAEILCQEWEELRERKELPQGALLPNQRVVANSKTELHRAALRRALSRLCEEHREELLALYLEEVIPTWPVDSPTPQYLPTKRLRKLGIVLARDDEEGLSEDD